MTQFEWKAATLQSGGITFKPEAKKRKKLVASLVGLVTALSLLVALSSLGFFVWAPSLPDIMDGDIVIADFMGHKESYNIHFDYQNEIIQLNYLSTDDEHHRHRRALSQGFIELNMTKVVIEDFKNKKRYFIVPPDGNTTLKCWKTELTGHMIPRDVLKYLKTGQVPQEIKDKYLKKYKFIDGMEVDVTTSGKSKSKIDKIVIRSKNVSMTLGGRNNSNYTPIDVNKLNCFDYDEATGKYDEKFEESDQINYELNHVDRSVLNLTRKMSAVLNELDQLQKTKKQANATVSRRRRENVDWFYGTWCGPKNGGYVNHCAKTGKCKEPYDVVTSECKACNPPYDDLDRDCMEHDRCLKEAGRGPRGCVPQGNRCTCDYWLGHSAYERVRDCVIRQKHACVWSATQIGFLFTKMLSCWIPAKLCFPTITTKCKCSKCTCPSIKFGITCVRAKLCIPFGSGKIFW